MRDPVIVFEKIQEVLPLDFKSSMDWHITTARYAAPEIWPSVYEKASHTISEIIGNNLPLKDKWKIKTIMIFTSKDITKLISERIVKRDQIDDFFQELLNYNLEEDNYE